MRKGFQQKDSMYTYNGLKSPKHHLRHVAQAEYMNILATIDLSIFATF